MPELALDVITLTDILLYRNSTKVFNNLSCQVKRDKVTAIMGLNDLASRDILRLITGQMTPASGDVLVNNSKLKLSTVSKDPIHDKVGLVLGSNTLHEEINIYKNVALPLSFGCSLPVDIEKDLVLFSLELVGLRHISKLMPAQLSSGIRLRTALACAIVNHPVVLLLNDPFNIKDFDDAGISASMIKQIHESLNLSTLIVSNDVESTFAVADYVYILSNGGVIASGTPNQLRNKTDKKIVNFIKGQTTYSRLPDENASIQQDFLYE
jgi:phospholipid/cholesterol/gamma-HCH transport system ATP-binding protein